MRSWIIEDIMARDDEGEFVVTRCTRWTPPGRRQRHPVTISRHNNMWQTTFPWIHWLSLATVLLTHCLTICDAMYPSSITGFYTDATAQQSVLMPEKVSPRLKKSIRNEILHLLGLEHRPKVRGHLDMTSAPQYMLELYKALEEGKEIEHSRNSNVTNLPGMGTNLKRADLIMSFVNQADLKELFTDGGRRMYFDFSAVPPTEGVTGAELRIFKFAAPWLVDRGPFHVRLFTISNDRRNSETVIEVQTDISVLAVAEGWLELNVTSAIEHWRRHPTEQVVLYVEVTDAEGRDLEPSAAGLVDHAGPRDQQAFLVTCFRANHKLHVRKSRTIHQRRHRRSSPQNANYYSDEKDYGWRYPPDASSKRACQRRQLYVSFRALGWESWVIAPEGYPAFYCDGECMFPLNVHMNATNHAIVQALVHLVKPLLAPNPCCAPTTLNAISFIYFDNSYNVVLKNYKNMVVQACGCH